MRRHSRLTRAAHAEAFLGLGKDDRRPAVRRCGGLEGGEQFPEVMPASLERIDLASGHLRDQRADFRILLEEMRQIVRPVSRAEHLVLAVDRGGEAAQQRMVDIPGEQRVPFRSPQDLDDVPARAAKGHLQVLDDLAIPPHRPVEALQVAVDDEGQVVEFLRAARERPAINSGSSISPSPNTPQTRRPSVSSEATIAQVAHEARLIDRADRPDAHGPGRGLPEVRHEPGMRIGAEAGAADFLPIAIELSSVSRPSRKARA